MKKDKKKIALTIAASLSCVLEFLPPLIFLPANQMPNLSLLPLKQVHKPIPGKKRQRRKQNLLQNHLLLLIKKKGRKQIIPRRLFLKMRLPLLLLYPTQKPKKKRPKKCRQKNQI